MSQTKQKPAGREETRLQPRTTQEQHLPIRHAGRPADLHIYIFTYLHIYMFTFLHIYIFTSIHIYTNTYLHIYIYTYLHIYIYTYLHFYIYTYIHIYICTYTHVHIYTYTHEYIIHYTIYLLPIDCFINCIVGGSLSSEDTSFDLEDLGDCWEEI